MRRVIGIDLDDVLADFIGAYTRLAHARFGRPEIGTAPVDWEWSNFGMTKEEQAQVWDDIKATPFFWQDLDVEPGASFEMMTRLDREHTLYFPTARVETVGVPVAKQSARFVSRNFSVEYPAVIVAYEKGPLATALKYDYFVDDRPKNCQDIKRALPSCRVFLKDSSHNHGFKCYPEDPTHSIVRIPTFDDFARIVLEQEG